MGYKQAKNHVMPNGEEICNTSISMAEHLMYETEVLMKNLPLWAEGIGWEHRTFQHKPVCLPEYKEFAVKVIVRENNTAKAAADYAKQGHDTTFKQLLLMITSSIIHNRNSLQQHREFFVNVFKG